MRRDHPPDARADPRPRGRPEGPVADAEGHGDVRRPAVRHQEIRPAVQVDILQGDGRRKDVRLQAGLRSQARVPGAQEYGQVRRGGIDDDQILPAIAVEVSQRERRRLAPGRVMDRRGEGSVPAAEKNGHVAIRGREGEIMSRVGDDEVVDTVTIEIAGRDRRWDVSDLIEGWLGEGPPAVTEVDRGVPGLGRDGEVRRVVAVEVTYNQTAHRPGGRD